MTLSSTLNGQQLELASITTYAVPLPQHPNQAVIGQKYIKSNNNREGDFWEHYCSLEAWRRGAEVYPNYGKTGLVDLIIEWNNMQVRCNVKVKVERDKNRIGCYYQESLSKIPDDIIMICPHPITRQINWHTHRVPIGWEDFWNEPTYEITD